MPLTPMVQTLLAQWVEHGPSAAARVSGGRWRGLHSLAVQFLLTSSLTAPKPLWERLRDLWVVRQRPCALRSLLVFRF